MLRLFSNIQIKEYRSEYAIKRASQKHHFIKRRAEVDYHSFHHQTIRSMKGIDIDINGNEDGEDQSFEDGNDLKSNMMIFTILKSHIK